MTATAEQLQEQWRAGTGLFNFLASTDHKVVAYRYLVTAFTFFLIAGLLALVMRIQLAWSELNIISADAFNQFFTMHGTAMIFLFATPVFSGFANYFIPLMIGSRDTAFPRLNSFTHWVFAASGIFIFSSFLVGSVPDGGWFAYVPLTGPIYRTDVGLDFWVVGLLLMTVATTGGAINFIVTILKLRAPGMSINRMPLFVWAMLATSFAVIFALPALTVGETLLEADRILGTQFFNPALGGDPLLWQHLFWFFGHPDVYIIFLPAVGIVSTVIPAFVRRPVAAYVLMALSMMLIAFIGFGVWVHHMFAVGLPQISESFFAAASMMIAIPSGVQVFAWIATIWGGAQVRFKTPFLFVLGFIVLFVAGGVTGVMFAVIPFDWQVHDTYFVVAHFHYVLFGGAVFPVLAGLYYWLPKMTGRMYNETLGQVNFWIMFAGFNLTFFPMHIMGLLGMPRRVYTYPDGFGWEIWNLASTAGSLMMGVGVLLFIYNFFMMLRSGPPAGNDPWEAGTLEWSTTSPPPSYNFFNIPRVYSRDPLWHTERPDLERELEEIPAEGLLEDLRYGRREVAGTSIHDADLHHRGVLPRPTIAPLVTAFGLLVFCYGMLPGLVGVKIIVAATGLLLAAGGALAWLWPQPPPEPGESPLPVNLNGIDAPPWWGMILFLITDAVVIGGLVTSYFYIRAGVDEWPMDGISPPDLLLMGVATALLAGSGAVMFLGERAIVKGRTGFLRGALLLTALAGLVFLGMLGSDYLRADFGLGQNAYTSLFFVLTGIHGLHVILGLGILGFTIVRERAGHFSGERYLGVQIAALFWYFVVATWLLIFATVYISPRII